MKPSSARLPALARVRSALLRGLRSFFEADGITEVRVPVLVDISGACENPATLFRVSSEEGFVLTQTGQLALEPALIQASAAFCHTGSYRSDAPDRRHLQEFELLEEEITWSHPALRLPTPHAGQLLDALCSRIERVVKAMISEAVDSCPDEIEQLGGPIHNLRRVLEQDFDSISYDEAAKLIVERQPSRDFGWGQDLKADDEAEILLARASPSDGERPTFITRYPEEIKFFNMMTSREDPRWVYSADLVLPYSGEAVGAAVREDDPALLASRFHRLMGPQLPRSALRVGNGSFDLYFEAVRLVPRHAGYGIGLERVIQFVLAERDIRQVSLPLMLGGNG
jgi:asparaginyl-tRNA synthetase